MAEYRHEHARKREVQGNAGVVHFEVQEKVGEPDDGHQSWKVWNRLDDAEPAMAATRAVRSFLPGREVRLAKITTEVMEVGE